MSQGMLMASHEAGNSKNTNAPVASRKEHSPADKLILAQ